MFDSKPTNASSEDKLDFKKILPIFVIVLIDLLGFTIIIPLMPLYATSFGADPWVIGLLGAAYPLMQFIGAPFLGRLSDRYGRKPILLISQLGTLIGFILLGFANALPLLFLSRIVVRSRRLRRTRSEPEPRRGPRLDGRLRPLGGEGDRRLRPAPAGLRSDAYASPRSRAWIITSRARAEASTSSVTIDAPSAHVPHGM